MSLRVLCIATTYILFDIRYMRNIHTQETTALHDAAASSGRYKDMRHHPMADTDSVYRG